MTDLTKNERAYAFLSKADQDKVKGAKREGRVVCYSVAGKWGRCDKEAEPYGECIYRIIEDPKTVWLWRSASGWINFDEMFFTEESCYEGFEGYTGCPVKFVEVTT
jgi:hypothetical protein